jgi:hypothetical protein
MSIFAHRDGLAAGGDIRGDDRIVAAIDLKTEREKKKLKVQKWTWIGKVPRSALKPRIEQELHRFEAFQLASTTT